MTIRDRQSRRCCPFLDHPPRVPNTFPILSLTLSPLPARNFSSFSSPFPPPLFPSPSFDFSPWEFHSPVRLYVLTVESCGCSRFGFRLATAVCLGNCLRFCSPPSAQTRPPETSFQAPEPQGKSIVNSARTAILPAQPLRLQYCPLLLIPITLVTPALLSPIRSISRHLV